MSVEVQSGPEGSPSGASHVVWHGRDEEAVDLLPVGVGTVAAFARRSPAKDTVNEDALLVSTLSDGRALFAIADGIGGHAAGERASRTALEALMVCTDTAVSRGASLRDGVLDGFDAADKAIAGLGIGAGTTLCVVSLERGENGSIQLRSYNVGDSAALLCGQRGKLEHQTVMHSPVGYAVESGLLDQDEAIHHEERHLISNAVGVGGMKIEIGPMLTMARRATLLLATDGLWDNLRTDEVVETVRRGPIQRVARELAALAARRMSGEDAEQPAKPDDLAFVVFRRGG